MFSGKTEELIRRIKRAKIARQRVEIFKPAIDVRYSSLEVVSHDENAIRSTPVENSSNILLNTTNKSECAVGYGTLYGDMNGGLSVLGDVYKTDVYRLAHYINRNGEVIPENSILKPPSAELRPGQKDTDSLPEYDVLDKILFHYIELNQSPADIALLGFDQGLVQRVVSMVNSNEYKRFQAAPILRVSSKAFGFGRKMPIVARF